MIINLLKSADRLLAISDSFKELGLEFERFHAIDGSSHTMNIYETDLFRNSDFNYTVLKGVTGCALSHLYVWQHLISKNVLSALIFEDDAVPLPGMATFWFDPQFDIIFLYNTLANPSDVNEICLYPANKWIGCGAVAYYINIKACRILTGQVYTHGFERAVDWFIYSNIHNLKIGYCKRPLVSHSDTLYSTIGNANQC
jgi:GR25 family glycosyltransferase involved in LPS biosynthesis